jgi:hypothetical protein
VGLAGALWAADEEAGALHAQAGSRGPVEGAAGATCRQVIVLVIQPSAEAGGGVAPAPKAGAQAGCGGGEAGLQLRQDALHVVQQHRCHEWRQRPAGSQRTMGVQNQVNEQAAQD